jgi:hypothetical protein
MAIVRACAPTGNDKLVARGYAVLWLRPAGFAERTKVPQVFGQPRGSPALQKTGRYRNVLRGPSFWLTAWRTLDQNFFDRIAVVDIQALLAWNFQAAWNTDLMKARRKEAGAGCFCTHESNCYYPSLPFNPGHLIKIKRLEKDMKKAAKQLAEAATKGLPVEA